MPDAVTVIGPWQFSTFTLALGAAFVLALALSIVRLRGLAEAGHVVDVALLGLAGGAVGARLVHVLIEWHYFGDHASEIARLSAGGLDWHGAVGGALAGLALGARWRGLPLSRLLDRLAPALALLALGGWYGCLAAACGFGAEVDTLARHPAYAVAETRDVYGIVAPRYSTQLFGLGLVVVVLALSAAFDRMAWLRGRRFWLALALLSAGMFAIGFVRGDNMPLLLGLRADQWLDLTLVVLSALMMALRSPGRGRSSRQAGVESPST